MNRITATKHRTVLLSWLLCLTFLPGNAAAHATSPTQGEDLCFMQAAPQTLTAPTHADTAKASSEVTDSLVTDSLATAINGEKMFGDKVQTKLPKPAFVPNPQRALWLSLVFPGAGQIYNRKYWKLPIVYGGFVGCAYAMRWNNMMYKDYSQAYMDIMDDDPNTQSYNQFLHLGNKVDESNKDYYQDLFRKRKDRYRKWRDMSFFCMVGVYLLSVVDAYVDASLSEFDISKDLSLRVAPSVLENSEEGKARNPFKSSAVGFQCSLNF